MGHVLNILDKKENTRWPLESSTQDLIFTLVCMVVSIAHILGSLSLLSSTQNRHIKGQL